MLSGTIKHYNNEKGYGFIKVSGSSQDVFFHISQWHENTPPRVGQPVYFLSAYNDKQQLRATKLSTTPFNHTPHSPKNASNHNSNPSPNAAGSEHRKKQSSNKNWVTLMITAFAIVGTLLFGSDFLSDNTLPSQQSQNQQIQNSSSQNEHADRNNRLSVDSNDDAAVTGDAQINKTIALIQQGGPFPYPEKDGTTFYNREGKLPKQSRGYYKEYTVPTPNLSHRGARRIVTGGNPPEVYYLTLDHYETFKKLHVD